MHKMTLTYIEATMAHSDAKLTSRVSFNIARSREKLVSRAEYAKEYSRKRDTASSHRQIKLNALHVRASERVLKNRTNCVLNAMSADKADQEAQGAIITARNRTKQMKAKQNLYTEKR